MNLTKEEEDDDDDADTRDKVKTRIIEGLMRKNECLKDEIQNEDYLRVIQVGETRKNKKHKHVTLKCSPRIRKVYLSIYIPWPFPPVWAVADNTQETTKQWGFHSVLLAMTRDPAEFGWHCWSNTDHPPLSSTTYVASYMPFPLLPLPPGCLYKATPWQQQIPIRTASQSFATHSYP